MLHNVWTEDSAEDLENGIFGRSHYDWNVSRIALNLQGEILAHWGVWGYTMRVGQANVRVGGVGWVATRKDKRKKGLMTELGHASLKAMREAGYDLSTLQGYTHNYARFGYVRAWNDDAYEIALGYLPATPITLLEFQLGRSAEAQRCYNKIHQTFTGTAHRPTYTLLPHRIAYCWNAPEGEMLGYVLVDKQADALVCYEATGDTKEILSALAKLAKEQNCERIRFETLHHYHPVLKYLRRTTCTRKTNYQAGDGWMVRLVNLPSALEKVKPELVQRLQRSEFADWCGELALQSEKDEVTLELNEGHIHVSSAHSTKHKVESEAIVQLLIGTDEPVELIDAAHMTLKGEARRLCEALFPRQYPSLSSWDMF